MMKYATTREMNDFTAWSEYDAANCDANDCIQTPYTDCQQNTIHGVLT